jgi:serine protease Do
MPSDTSAGSIVGPLFRMAHGLKGLNRADHRRPGTPAALFAPPGTSAADPLEHRPSVGETRSSASGALSSGWLGVQIQSVTSQIAEALGLKNTAGALVYDVSANGPAANAGIMLADVLISLDGTPIPDAQDLTYRINSMASGSTVKLGLIRKSRGITLR